jgi:hypothetical protein
MPKVYARVLEIDGGVLTEVYRSSSRNGKVLAERWVDQNSQLFCTYRIILDKGEDQNGYAYEPKAEYNYIIRRRVHHLGITRYAAHFDVNDPHTEIEKISRAWCHITHHKCERFTEAEAYAIVHHLRKIGKEPNYYDFVDIDDARKPAIHSWMKIDGVYMAVCKSCGMMRKRIDPGSPGNEEGRYPISQYYHGGQLQPMPRAPMKTPACGRVWLTGSANMVEVNGVRMLLLPPIDPEDGYGTGNELSSTQTQTKKRFAGARNGSARKRHRTVERPSSGIGAEVFTVRDRREE